MKGRAGSLKEHFPITVRVPNLDSLTGHWEFKRSTQCYRTFKDLCIMLGWVTPLTFSKLQINVPINFWFEWNWEFLALLSVRYKKETDETWMPLKRSCKDMLVKSPLCRSEFLRLSNSGEEFWDLIFGPGILSGVVGRTIDFLFLYSTELKSRVPPQSIRSLFTPVASLFLLAR